MELKKLLQQAFEAGNNSAQMPSDYWEGIDRDFEEWYLEYAAQKLKDCMSEGKKQVEKEATALSHSVSNSALEIKPIDPTLSPQIQQFLDDMQKANEELEKAATKCLMIPAKYFK